MDWASYLCVYLKLPSNDKENADKLDNVLGVTGERGLPRMWPTIAFLEKCPVYPVLVTFGD